MDDEGQRTMDAPLGYFYNAGVLYRVAKCAYERTESARSDTGRSQNDALTALLFSAATLEAFIAELANVAKKVAGFDPTSSRTLLAALAEVLDEIERSRGSVRLKYLMARAILSGQAYEKGQKPYQDFDLLFTIRDAILHHKPEEITPEPHRIIAGLSSRGLCERSEPHVKRSWLDQIRTRAVARWACNVVRDMVASIREGLPKDADKKPNPLRPLALLCKGFDGVD